MLASLANIFRIPDLRKKVVFTLTIIAIYQFGANVPVPFVNFSKVAQLSAASKSSGVLGFLNLFSGGALTRMAVFGLGIMPYITSSIIIQLLATVIPKLEQWRDQGAVGQKKLTQTTRYLTVALALMQSTGSGLPVPQGRRRPPRHQPERRPDPQLLALAGRVHHPHPHRRHRLRDVAGRAHHPTGHRPGHVHPDLRQRGGRHPLGAQHGPPGGRSGQVLGDPDGLAGPAGAHRLRRPGPAADPGHLRQTGGGPQDVRRLEHLHPAQGQPGRRDPDHLRQLGAVHPGPAVQHHPVGGVPELGEQQRDPDQRLLHPHLLHLHPPVHLLLRLRGLRPAPAGGHHPQAGRVHPRHPSRATRPSATWPTSSTGSPGRAPSSSAGWPSRRPC